MDLALIQPGQGKSLVLMTMQFILFVEYYTFETSLENRNLLSRILLYLS